MKKTPSIFNDVIGPIMRGPSSSHTAASWRIAKCCLDILNEPLKKAIIGFDKNSVWAYNYREQGTVMGINGGLLGIDIIDNLMKDTDKAAEELKISINYEVASFPTKHVNTVRLKLDGVNGKSAEVIAASLGGGSFEIQKIDGSDVSICGDYFELLVQCRLKEVSIENIKKNLPPNIQITHSVNNDVIVINLKSPEKITDDIYNYFNENPEFENITIVNPVLPIISGNETEMPYTNVDSMLKFAEREKLNLGELGMLYEKCRSGISDSELKSKMNEIIRIIENGIKTGLSGTTYKDRILQQQSHLIGNAAKMGKIINNSLINNIIANVSAIMEAKSAMEVIVANPTAGSCGAVGGVIKAVADELNSTSEEIVNAYFAAGLAGAYFAKGPGFSAEEHGCQVECGASAGMAAAGLVQLFGGTAQQAMNAASIALQNMIGLVCDPIADRVEAPCLGKNISAAVNALSSATMACSGFDAVIPYEEVLETVSRVSKQMPTCVKCTGRGGLAITPTALKIKERLSQN